MERFQVFLSEEAERDLQQYIDFIMWDCKAPLTALRHYEHLFNTLKSLEYMPERYAVQTGISFLRFEPNVRRINYKKMAIIFTIHGNIVYIHRIMPANLITSL